jgi:hypothetical protein
VIIKKVLVNAADVSCVQPLSKIYVTVTEGIQTALTFIILPDHAGLLKCTAKLP